VQRQLDRAPNVMLELSVGKDGLKRGLQRRVAVRLQQVWVEYFHEER